MSDETMVPKDNIVPLPTIVPSIREVGEIRMSLIFANKAWSCLLAMDIRNGCSELCHGGPSSAAKGIEFLAKSDAINTGWASKSRCQ